MVGLNEYIDSGIITPNGVMSIKDAHIGDKIYDYYTGEISEIKDIKETKLCRILNVHFSDGRSELRPFYESLLSHRIKMNAIEYHKDDITDILEPDPYTAGALLIYGDWSDNYINLPIDKCKVDSFIMHRYNANYASKLGKNKNYFSYNSRPNMPITWDEFFNKYDLYVKTGKRKSPPIPHEYIHSSIRDREKFIRGVFDIGYDHNRFKGSICLEHTDENKLLIVQRILWSLGITSKIEYDPVYKEDDWSVHKYPNKREWRLTVLGSKKHYPGFFYDIFNIEDAILENSWLDKLTQWEMKVVSSEYYCTGYMLNIVLDKPRWFYTSNFLPRLSTY